MSKQFLTIILACAVPAGLIRAEDATLRWNNGDSLSGTFVRADDKTLTWRSPMFTVPLQIEMSHLASVQFPQDDKVDTAIAAEAFRIQLRNGDLLNGRLKSITDSMISFESDRFGTFEIPRHQIRGLHRAANSGLIYSGPRGLEGWQSAFRRNAGNNPNGGGGVQGLAGRLVRVGQPEEKSKPEDADATIWIEEPDGSVTTKKADAAMFLPLPLPDRFEIEFEVSSTKVSSFLMAIGQDPKRSRRIETWIDVLVAANGTDFVTLRTIGEKDLSVHLHVFVDRQSKTMQAYSASGKLLGEITTPGLQGEPEGLLFRNGEFDLSIRRLRVSHWDGKPPRIVSGDNSRIELRDGTMHFGQVQAFDAASGILTLTIGTESIETPIAEVGSIIVSSPATSEPETQRGAAWLRWSDGSYVSGSLVSVIDETAELKTSYAVETLKCRTPGIVQLGLSRSVTAGVGAEVPANQSEEADRLFHDNGTLQGSLVVDGAADAPIQWKPLGGVNASTLEGVGNARFVRASGIRHFSEDRELLTAFPDVVYLKNNDVLPCRVESCSPDEIRFTSPLTEARSFTREHIRAIELSAAGRIHQSGFGAEGWKGLNSKQKADPGKLEFRGNVEYSHPEILTGDTVRFRIEWPKQSWASLTVSMFGTGRRDDQDSTHVCLTLQPGQIQVLDRPVPQNQLLNGMRMGGQNQDAITPVKDCRADIQLVARDGNIMVSVNGKPVKGVKMNPSSSGRRGISLNANVVMVGQVIMNGRPQQRSGDVVTLSNFEVDNLSGASIRQFIEEESRQAALTIPRFRRDNPPTHVLIAPNGDLLRGRMQSMDASHVLFESRLETLRLERSRVGALVWLDAPARTEDTPPDAADSSAVPEPAPTPVPVMPTPFDAAPFQAAPVEAAPVKPAVSDAEGFAQDHAEVEEAMLQAQLADGFSITMKPLQLVDGRIEGTSALLGKCSFPARSVRELFTGDLKNGQRLAAYDTWVTHMAREPDWDIPKSDGGNSEASELIGKAAPDFELPMLDGTTFKLSEHQDKIVVLDFWATWCGPCVMALPDYIAATSKFDESKVLFVAVNLQETSDQIRSFLAEKQWSPRVALDRGAEVAPLFQVSGIPHTVIVGPGNVVEDVHVGYQPGSGETMQISIQQMLDGTWKRPTAEPAESGQ